MDGALESTWRKDKEAIINDNNKADAKLILHQLETVLIIVFFIKSLLIDYDISCQSINQSAVLYYYYYLLFIYNYYY